MQIRPATAGDLELIDEIDATIDSTRYLHIEKTGEGLGVGWRVEERPLRQKLIEPNRLSDDSRFAIRQIANGIEDGITLVAEHEDRPVALLAAQPRPGRGVMKLLDVRVDFELRRQGLASAMAYQLIQTTRDAGLRAIAAEAKANNFPANSMLAKLGFEMAGLDERRQSNHDLVKEAVTLFWYAVLD